MLDYTLIQLGTYQLTVIHLIQIVIIFIGTYLFLAFVEAWFRRVVKRKHYDEGRAHSISLLVGYFTWISSILYMLSILGFQASVFIASSAALFVGLGLGLQSIFKDFVSGVFILFEGTIEVGDILEVERIIGRVDQIHLRTTKILTRDDVVVIVPNSKVLSENVVNWSHNNTSTRFRIPIRIPFGVEPQHVKSILLQIANTAEDVQTPEVRITEFHEKHVQYELVFYSHGSLHIEDLKSDLRFQILHACAQAGITMVA